MKIKTEEFRGDQCRDVNLGESVGERKKKQNERKGGRKIMADITFI